MVIYTLDDNFLPVDIIDAFVSCIWTERYSTFGDTQIVVPATPSNISKLAEGTFLSLPGAKEPMIVETQSIENRLLTVTGQTLASFFNQRAYRFSAAHFVQQHDISMVNVGGAIKNIVDSSCVAGAEASLTSYGLDGPKEVIANLSVVNEDLTSATVTTAETGPVGDVIVKLAQDNALGLALIISEADASGYELVLRIYRGKNRTSSQSEYPPVRFSPNQNTLANVKELRSQATYKNIVYVFAPNIPEKITSVSEGEVTPVVGPGVAYLSGANLLTDFDRRVLLYFDRDLNIDSLDKSTEATIEAGISAYLSQRAKDILANFTYTRLVDGEIVPQSEFTYGQHYNLGDIIELEGYSGELQQARITEYIRTQDKTGERSYPTVSVIA